MSPDSVARLVRRSFRPCLAAFIAGAATPFAPAFRMLQDYSRMVKRPSIK
jgi:hypothetical protein